VRLAGPYDFWKPRPKAHVILRELRGITLGRGEATALSNEDPIAKQAANAAMDRYACGDDAAFAELYDLLSGRLFAFLVRRTGDTSRAEDLLQQTFLQMHCARESYVRGADVLPWAFCIARRLLIDGYRKGSREVMNGEDLDERLIEEFGPDDLLRSKQAAQLVTETLAGLPEAQRAAFELIKYDGLSLVEAAEVLGTTVTAVKLRAHRTYEALRAALRPGVLEGKKS
jgi:RNA polymerase sigma-70 factor (ECF subfamily)